MSDLPVVGRDVSKAQLDGALRPTPECWQVNNDEAGIAGLVERLRTVHPTLVVLEAPGGLEGPVTGIGMKLSIDHSRKRVGFAQ